MMAVVGAGLGRVANRDLQLGPYTIPKHTMLWVPIQAMHSSADLWEQPDKFMPVWGCSLCACTSFLGHACSSPACSCYARFLLPKIPV